VRGWVDRIAAPAAAGSLLSVAAAGESIVRAPVLGLTAQAALALGLIALATTLPLVFLPPTAAAVAVVAAGVLSLALFDTVTVAGLITVLVVLYRLAFTWAPGLAVPFVVVALVHPAPLTVLLAALAPAAALTGIARRARDEAVVHRAARQAVAGTLVEHTALGERARIARELHDVVAHHISVIAVQAETARLTTPGMPAAGARRLSEIGDTARAGLTEMRRLLGVLRADGVAERHPQPGLQQLNELLDEARDAGGAGTRLIISGPPVTLDPGVELAAYRIVQEALTNARRHAPGAAVDVELHYTDDTLRLRIRDNGPGPSSTTPTGHGLPGMHERAAAVGGRLRVGPAAVGGFLVEATLPAKVEAAA
jgi:signal transduction histidine kinase